MGETVLRSLPRPSWALPALLLWLGVAKASAQPAPVQTTPASPVVVAVELAGDGEAADLEALADLVTIASGQALSPAAVRRTLTNLYASGRAREVEVRSRPVEGGVVITIVLWSETLVTAVEIEGEPGLKKRELLSELERGIGAPLVESRVLRGVYALTELYERRGYLEPRVRVRIVDSGVRLVKVVFDVASGPRARVAKVEFIGDLGSFSAADLVGRLGLEPGADYSRPALDNALEKLRRDFFAEGFRALRLGLPIESYDPEADGMSLSIPIYFGPRVETEIVGADLEQLQKKELLPFLGPDGYDEALVDQAVERIRVFYQQRGHYQVKVEPTVEPADGVVRVRIAITPGEKLEIREVRFEGNDSFSAKELAPFMATAPPGLFSFGGGGLVDTTLAADRSNLEAYYRLNGFIEATVTMPLVEIEGSELVVVVPILEGQRRRVGRLDFEGFAVFEPKNLTKELARLVPPLEAGEPYHPRRLEAALGWLRSEYDRDGYARAEVLAQESWDPTGTVVDLRFVVREGLPTVIDRVIVRGNTRTRTEVVRRAMELESGQNISRARLLDAERNLYRLGVFSEVEVDLAPADPGALERDVVARVEEGQTHRLVYGVGYDSEDQARVLLGYTSSNLFGRGYTLGADLRLSGLGDDEQGSRVRITFDQPYVGRFNIPLTYTLFSIEEARPTFRVERAGARVEAVKELGANDRFGLVLEYREVKPDRDIGERVDRRISISSLTPTIYLDARDDPVDPSRGGSFLGQVQYAARIPEISTDESFVKGFAQATGLLPLGRAGVLVGSLRLGAIEPLREEVLDPVLDPALPSSRVSIAERFFLGGTTTHRAFAQDELGLLGRTLLLDTSPETLGRLLPQGGNGLALLNLDWRFPIAGSLGGVIFFDAGNVWADWRDIDAGEARLGAGAALRYLTPIGPIQIGIAFKLDQEELEKDEYELVISLGNPF